MGREDNNRATRGVSRYLPSDTRRRARWNPAKRLLRVDIAINKVDELEYVHKQMLRRQPCIAMVRVCYNDGIWGYFTGAAVGDKHHLTTIGVFCYNLMIDAFSSA